MGVSSVFILASFHLIDSGQAMRIKRVVKQEGGAQITTAAETAAQVRTNAIIYIECNAFSITSQQLTIV